jgi:thymidylate kinase
MVDIIQMGILIHFPVILEGISGKGKHTAIQYISQVFNYQIVSFSFSSSTSIEDIFLKLFQKERMAFRICSC